MTNNNNQFGYAISIVDHNNEKWVRVQAMGEDFIIALHDLTDKKGQVMDELPQPILMKRLKKLGLTTFNRKQGFIIATLIEEIHTKLEEAGGDKFINDWYASSESWLPLCSSINYDNVYVWYFNGNNGCFEYGNQHYYNFRSRAVLNYGNKENVL